MWSLILFLLPSLSTSQSSLVQRSDNAEVLLSRGSSFLSLSEPLVLRPGFLLGFSFRTCLAAGQLVTQHGSGADSLVLSLSRAGQLSLEVRAGEVTGQLVAGRDLADGGWHTVRLGVSPDQHRLCLSVDADVECNSPSPSPQVSYSQYFDAEILSTQDHTWD